MDGRNFDQLARAVATGTTRRRVLGMIGTAFAAVGGIRGSRSALAGDTCETFAEQGGTCNPDQGLCCGPPETCHNGTCIWCSDYGQPCELQQSGLEFTGCCPGLECRQDVCVSVDCSPGNDSCNIDADCCSGSCIDGQCFIPCAPEGEFCGNIAGAITITCCDGLTCVDGICEEPGAKCVEEGGICSDSSDCCEGFECIDGTCGTIPEPECIEDGEACEVDSDCCDGICCAGFCRNIECCIDEPNPNDRCPEGTSCFEGICEGVAELCEDDSTCGSGTCCCEDGSCSSACCPAPPPPPEDEKEEPVTQLPNTGIGDDPSGRSGWIGAAALGAAAAFFGSKRLKLNEQPRTIED